MKLTPLVLLLLVLPGFAAATDWNDLPKEFADAIVFALSALVIVAVDVLAILVGILVAFNPNPFAVPGIVTLHSQVLILLAPLYLLALCINGIQIMTSRVVSSKATARETLQGTIISMLLVIFSRQIYELLLLLGQSLAFFFGLQTLVLPDSVTAASLLLLIPLLITLLFAVPFFFFRIIMIYLGAVLFPIALFTYFFGPTKFIGNILLKLLVSMLLVQVIWMLTFAVISLTTGPIMAASFPDMMTEATAKLMLYTTGLIVSVAVPLVFLAGILMTLAQPEIAALMKVVGLAKEASAAINPPQPPTTRVYSYDNMGRSVK